MCAIFDGDKRNNFSVPIIVTFFNSRILLHCLVIDRLLGYNQDFGNVLSPNQTI